MQWDIIFVEENLGGFKMFINTLKLADNPVNKNLLRYDVKSYIELLNGYIYFMV